MDDDAVAKLRDELAAERAKVVMAAEVQWCFGCALFAGGNWTDRAMSCKAGQMLVIKVQGLEQQLEAKDREATTMQAELNRLRDDVDRFEVRCLSNPVKPQPTDTTAPSSVDPALFRSPCCRADE